MGQALLFREAGVSGGAIALRVSASRLTRLLPPAHVICGIDVVWAVGEQA
jgi:hypothetical protein